MTVLTNKELLEMQGGFFSALQTDGTIVCIMRIPFGDPSERTDLPTPGL